MMKKNNKLKDDRKGERNNNNIDTESSLIDYERYSLQTGAIHMNGERI